MPAEGHESALLIDHCWSVYLLLTEHLSLPANVAHEFPALVERVLIARVLRLSVAVSDQLKPPFSS